MLCVVSEPLFDNLKVIDRDFSQVDTQVHSSSLIAELLELIVLGHEQGLNLAGTQLSLKLHAHFIHVDNSLFCENTRNYGYFS